MPARPSITSAPPRGMRAARSAVAQLGRAAASRPTKARRRQVRARHRFGLARRQSRRSPPSAASPRRRCAGAAPARLLISDSTRSSSAAGMLRRRTTTAARTLPPHAASTSANVRAGYGSLAGQRVVQASRRASTDRCARRAPDDAASRARRTPAYRPRHAPPALIGAIAPKSISLARPSRVQRMLRGLTSRCSKRRECKQRQRRAHVEQQPARVAPRAAARTRAGRRRRAAPSCRTGCRRRAGRSRRPRSRADGAAAPACGTRVRTAPATRAARRSSSADQQLLERDHRGRSTRSRRAVDARHAAAAQHLMQFIAFGHAVRLGGSVRGRMDARHRPR